jgi:hypothetical protein
VHDVATTDTSIPRDREYALLEVVCHSILNVRGLACEMSPEQLFDLMDAIHNIPIYLQHGGDDFWETIEFDIARYDEIYRAGLFPKLQDVFDRGIQQYALKIQNSH